MEAMLSTDRAPPRLRSDKNQTSFVKDAPKITRYSLADSADATDGGMDYHVQIVTPDDKLRVLKFLRRFFFRDEPLNQSIQLIPEGEDSTCVELEEYCSTACIENNLSLMAVSTSGAIIGVILNAQMEPIEESESDEEPEYIKSCQNQKFKKILTLLRKVDRDVQATGLFRGQNVLEIRIISVDANWRGKGVARTLIDKSLEIARERGFDVARADCSSHFSGKLCARVGFEPAYQLKYADYADESGTPVFSPAMPHAAVVTYIKTL